MRNLIKKVVILVLALSILVIPKIEINAQSDQKISFKDVKSTSWYYSYVTRLSELKITGGYLDGTYRPNNSVTRAEFVTFLCNVKGYKQTQGNPFIDSQKSWASGYITAALANGIIDLPENKKFRPNAAITRQEVVEMMCKSLNVTPDETSKTPYVDVTANTGYSSAAYSNYLMQGSTKNNKQYFNPNTKITRGEVATVVVNAYDYNTDKMAFLNKKMGEENKKKEDAVRHQEWLAGMDKGVSKELLSNTDLLGDYSLEEQHFRLMDDLKNGKWPGWSEVTGISDDKLADEMVKVGRKVVELWINADYTKTDIIKHDWANVMIEGYNVDSKVKKIITNTWVREGYFYTSESLLTYDSVGQPTLRGTVRYRWVNPSKNTGENKVGVWYEEDIKLGFYPQSSGIKADGFWFQLTDTRIVK